MIILLTVVSLGILAASAAYMFSRRHDSKDLHPMIKGLWEAATFASICWMCVVGSQLFVRYVYCANEIDGSGYEEIASIKENDASLDRIIEESMKDGSISYWEYDGIRRAFEARERVKGRTGLAKSLSDGRPAVLRNEHEKEAGS